MVSHIDAQGNIQRAFGLAESSAVLARTVTLGLVDIVEQISDQGASEKLSEEDVKVLVLSTFLFDLSRQIKPENRRKIAVAFDIVGQYLKDEAP